MRITLAQWRDKYGLPTTMHRRTYMMTLFEVPDCSGCSMRWIAIAEHEGHSLSLCSYHEGFVDGFDAARGGG